MVRTRFAPSPTGYLHIGGVRTALYNWLFARGQGGQFVLRIDDTDRKRNLEQALQPILDGFRWLGIDWDEGAGVGGPHGPYYQSERAGIYDGASEQLVARGLAYHDYARPDELQAEREAAQAAGQRFLYSRNWMAESEADRRRFEAEGREAVVRLKMPREGSCRFVDRIRGAVEFEWAREQDHVIRRADGTCLYHLASVIDDEAMRISHVIRAEEHLSNTPRQIFIARGLGCEPPEFAHLPVVAEPGSKNKLSKRKLEKYLKNPEFSKLNQRGCSVLAALGEEPAAETFNPVIVDFYERTGFLPEAVLNYLLLLGWALDDRTETFSRDEMIQAFSLERVNRAPASFDPVKLMAFESRYMAALPVEERVERVIPFLVGAGHVRSPVDERERSRIRAVVAAAGDRIEIGGDVLQFDEFFTTDEALEFDETPFDKRLVRPAGAADLLRRFSSELRTIEPFDAATIERSLREFLEREAIKIGQLIHALRVAVTGKAVGFGMFETLEILGKQSCLARIERALSLVPRESASAGDPGESRR